MRCKFIGNSKRKGRAENRSGLREDKVARSTGKVVMGAGQPRPMFESSQSINQESQRRVEKLPSGDLLTYSRQGRCTVAVPKAKTTNRRLLPFRLHAKIRKKKIRNFNQFAKEATTRGAYPF